MSYLHTLTPAENLVLRDNSKGRLRDLLKATMLDLLMKQVLVFHEVVKDPDKRGRPRIYKYVEAGPRFNEHLQLDLRTHEAPFVVPFNKSTGTRYLFKNLVRIAFHRAVNTRAYHALILSEPRMMPLRSGGLFNWFGIARLNASGKVAREVLLAEIARAEAELVPLLNAKDDRARQLLTRLNGNVLLLQGIDLSMLPDLSIGEMDNPSRPGWSGTGCSGCSSFGGFDSGFDAGADAAGCGGDGGSGCSGSGCAGSGCGGCGGCGGGCS